MISLDADGKLQPLFGYTEPHLSAVFRAGHVWKRVGPETYKVRDELRSENLDM